MQRAFFECDASEGCVRKRRNTLYLWAEEDVAQVLLLTLGNLTSKTKHRLRRSSSSLWKIFPFLLSPVSVWEGWCKSLNSADTRLWLPHAENLSPWHRWRRSVLLWVLSLCRRYNTQLITDKHTRETSREKDRFTVHRRQIWSHHRTFSSWELKYTQGLIWRKIKHAKMSC